ncbi:MAG: hypothetical protein LC808_19405, partial [Actinobacteria bacterium]|nr:hypothetical protein [Actinomycetota bacterium]
MERGLSNPSVAVLRQLAVVLGLSELSSLLAPYE